MQADTSQAGDAAFPKTLLDSPTVTFYFDGLIFTTYNRERRLYQAGVHTQAEHHGLIVEVTTGGGKEKLWPLTPADWDPSHAVVKSIAPLWLYVDSGKGLQPEEFSAELHRPDDLGDPQSFGHIFEFESGLYNRPLALRPALFAAFNFPHGIFYSAENTDAKLSAFDQGHPPTSAAVLKNIHVSTLGAGDIGSAGEGKYIVLAKNDGADELFRFPLEAGVHYEIKVMNIPNDQHAGHNAAAHFLQFYELFPLQPREQVFLVQPAEATPLPPVDIDLPLPSPDSPPCVQTKGSLSDGLPPS